MLIVIPMAGRGQRFIDAGFEKPKPLIDVCGKPMIQRVIENLGVENDFVFIIQESHWHKYTKEFMNIFQKVNSYTTYLTDGITEGALCTVLIAHEELRKGKNRPLMIANSDQIVNWGAGGREAFYNHFYNSDTDGTILTFHSQEPKHSYAVLENGFVTKVVEKEVVSNNATIGVYLWRKANDFLLAANEMILNKIKTNNEYYLAPTYNINIKNGAKIDVYNITSYPIGTPEDLEIYKEVLNEY